MLIFPSAPSPTDPPLSLYIVQQKFTAFLDLFRLLTDMPQDRTAYGSGRVFPFPSERGKIPLSFLRNTRHFIKKRCAFFGYDVIFFDKKFHSALCSWDKLMLVPAALDAPKKIPPLPIAEKILRPPTDRLPQNSLYRRLPRYSLHPPLPPAAPTIFPAAFRPKIVGGDFSHFHLRK